MPLPAGRALVGNIPRESVIAALEQRGMELSIGKSFASVMEINSLIASDYQ